MLTLPTMQKKGNSTTEWRESCGGAPVRRSFACWMCGRSDAGSPMKSNMRWLRVLGQLRVDPIKKWNFLRRIANSPMGGKRWLRRHQAVDFARETSREEVPKKGTRKK
jgi:hypothetical protein